MVLIDANVILRSFLNDNDEMVAKVRKFVAVSTFFVRHEVLAEVIHVLRRKVYYMEKGDIVGGIMLFLSHPNVTADDEPVLNLALRSCIQQKNMI